MRNLVLGKEISKFDKILPERSVLDNFTLLKDFTKYANTCGTHFAEIYSSNNDMYQ